MKPTVKFVMSDVHMGLGHHGLRELIRMHKKKSPLFRQHMDSGDGLVLFINKSKTACKMLSHTGNVMGYLRLEYPLTENSLDEIPETFGGSLAYAQAAKTALAKLLVKEGKPRASFIEKARLAS